MSRRGPFGYIEWKSVRSLFKGRGLGKWGDCKLDTDSEMERRICEEIKRQVRKKMEEDIPEIDEVADLNYGWCYSIADGTYVALGGPEGLEIWENHAPLGSNHGYLHYGGKFFDAENPTGVSDRMQMEHFKESPSIIGGETHMRHEGETAIGLTSDLKEFLEEEDN